MEVLDLLFNFRFNTRLEQFVFEFKRTHHKATMPNGEMPEIGTVTSLTYDMHGSGTSTKIAESLSMKLASWDDLTQQISEI